MRFAFIDVEKASYPMRILCRVLQVSRSVYYAWRTRKPSARNLEDERLRPKIVEAFKTGRGTRRRRGPRSQHTGRAANQPRQSRSSSEIVTGSLPASRILSITRCESRISASKKPFGSSSDPP